MDWTKLIISSIRHLCTAFLLFVPLLILNFIVNLGWFKNVALSKLNLPIQTMTVENWQWYGVIAIAGIPLMIKAWGVFYLRRLFSQFSLGHYFIAENIAWLKKFAFSLLIVGVLNPVVLTIASVVLSINHPDGQKILSINIGSHDFALIFNALVFWSVAYILEKGKSLDDENKQFV